MDVTHDFHSASAEGEIYIDRQTDRHSNILNLFTDDSVINKPTITIALVILVGERGKVSLTDCYSSSTIDSSTSSDPWEETVIMLPKENILWKYLSF